MFIKNIDEIPSKANCNASLKCTALLSLGAIMEVRNIDSGNSKYYSC
jgi:hypothetical protein